MFHFCIYNKNYDVSFQSFEIDHYFSRTKRFEVQHKHAIKIKKIFHNYMFYFMYKHLYYRTLNLEVAFLLSFSIALDQ